MILPDIYIFSQSHTRFNLAHRTFKFIIINIKLKNTSFGNMKGQIRYWEAMLFKNIVAPVSDSPKYNTFKESNTNLSESK